MDYYIPKTVPEAKLRAVSEDYRRREFNPDPSWRLHNERDLSPERDYYNTGVGYRNRGRGKRASYWNNRKSDKEFKYPDSKFRKILNKSRVAGGRLDTDVLFHHLQKPQGSDTESCTTTETVIRKQPPKPIRTSSGASTPHIRKWSSGLYDKQDQQSQRYRKSYMFSIVTDEPVNLKGDITGKTYAIVPEGATIKADSHNRGVPGQQIYQSRKQTQTTQPWLSTFASDFNNLQL